jgi:Rrf2 family protein
MLSLTRKTDYALVALAGLAAKWPSGDGGASAHELAERLDLPLPVLRNILKALARGGVVASTQGVGGGYRLARSAEQITLSDIVQAVQGPVRLALCCSDSTDERGEHVCRLEDSCRIKASVRGVHHRLMEFLGQVTLAQIASGEVAAGNSSPHSFVTIESHRAKSRLNRNTEHTEITENQSRNASSVHSVSSVLNI